MWSKKMKDFKELLAKIEDLKKEGKIDLSLDEDLSLAVMNLISLEEHFFFSGAKTGKDKYYDWLHEVRRLRQELLSQLVGKTEGEAWCVAKHLLAATMRLIEVGTKYQDKGNKKEAKKFFEKAWKVYALFWGVKLGLAKVKDLKKSKDASLEELLKKLVDCCQ